MKSKELRVGNLVYSNQVESSDAEEYPIGSFPLTVSGVHQVDPNYFYVYIKEVKAQVEGESLSGIPLTHEILLACGFERLQLDRAVWYALQIDEKTQLTFEKDAAEFGILGDSQFEWGNIKIKHLHQLQNLYFALAGEELAFTP